MSVDLFQRVAIRFHKTGQSGGPELSAPPHCGQSSAVSVSPRLPLIPSWSFKSKNRPQVRLQLHRLDCLLLHQFLSLCPHTRTTTLRSDSRNPSLQGLCQVKEVGERKKVASGEIFKK